MIKDIKDKLQNVVLDTYLIPVLFSIIVIAIISKWSLFTSTDNVRYFLSALAQVEAALIGIYLTIVVVGIQLTRDYSEVIYELYFKSRELWLILSSTLLLISVSIVSIGKSEWIASTMLNTRGLSIPIGGLIAGWATFNVIALIILLKHLFKLFYPRNLFERLFKVFPFYYSYGEDALRRYFRIAQKTIQTQNVEATLYLLTHINDEIQGMTKEMKDEIESGDYPGKKDSLEQKLKFIERLCYQLRSLSWYTIDQFEAKRISKDEAIWILEWIRKSFQEILPTLILMVLPKYPNAKGCVSQVILELDIVLEGIQGAPDEIKNKVFPQFFSLILHYYPGVLRAHGYNDIAEEIEEIIKKHKD